MRRCSNAPHWNRLGRTRQRRRSSRLAWLDEFRDHPPVLADLAIANEAETLVGGKCTVVQEPRRNCIRGLGVALNRAPAETGDQLERASQCGGCDPLAAVPFADVAASDSPVRCGTPLLLIRGTVLDSRHFVGDAELTPAHAIVAVENECCVRPPGQDAGHLAVSLGNGLIVSSVVLGVKPHAPAATEDAVVALDEPGERGPRRLVQGSDSERRSFHFLSFARRTEDGTLLCSMSRVVSQAMVIKVVVAEDSLLVRAGIVKLLGAYEDVEIAALCVDLPELLAAVQASEPDVVLTDIRMPPTGTDEGIRAAIELRERHPNVGVVVLSQYVEPSYALQLLDGGSHGRAYLLKERLSEGSQLINAIREVAAGGSVIDPKVVEALVTSRGRAKSSPLEFLTPRELDVLSEIAQGKNNAGVASSLVLSERAVEKHINSLFSKLGLNEEATVHRRVKAVLMYLADHEPV